MVGADRDRDFDAFVGARARTLVGLAYLITGHEGEAKRLARIGLASTYVDWGRVGGLGAAEPHAVRAMLAQHRKSAGRGGDPGPTGEPAGPEGASLTAGIDEPHDDVAQRARYERTWVALAQIPPRARAMLVLALRERMTDEDIARAYGGSPRRVRSDLADGLASSAAILSEPSGQLAEDIVGALALHADDVAVPQGLADDARAEALLMRSARRKRGAFVGAGAVAVVVLALVASSFVGGSPVAPADVGVANPTRSAEASQAPSIPAPSPSSPAVLAVPELVFSMARDNAALLAYGSVILDGASGDVIAVEAPAATGGSSAPSPTTTSARPGVTRFEIVSLARVSGGFAVVVRYPSGRSDTARSSELLFVPRVGEPTVLALVDEGDDDIAVAPDGLTVVHALPRRSSGPAEIRTRLIVQELSGRVIDVRTVQGWARPLWLDADRVWLERDDGVRSSALAWERGPDLVQELEVPGGGRILAIRGFELVLEVDRGRVCAVALDVRDPSSPTTVWRRCPTYLKAAVDPAGGLVAMTKLDPSGRFDAFDAATGDRAYGTAVLGGDPTQLTWTFDGLRTMVESVDPMTGAVVYTAIQAVDAAGSTVVTGTTYRLPVARVIFGQELPIPVTG